MELESMINYRTIPILNVHIHFFTLACGLKDSEQQKKISTSCTYEK